MQRRHSRNIPGRFRLLALAVASCFSAGADANPTGANVVSGQASISQSGKSLTVTNTPGAVIHWQSFSIGRDEVTRFVQQSPASAVLNRVVGQDPSKILGTLTSNGRVFLINPNGILFGEGARVDVAGMVASSLNLADKDFAAGRLRFGETPGAKGVENQGSIRTGTGGEVMLIAPDVKNSGIITSPKGEVILAAGRTVEIVDPKSPHMRVEITAPDNQAINLGTLIADGGRVSIYAASIRNSGRIQANTVERTSTGEIVLKAKKDVTLDKGSVITANGESAGRIVIQAETGTASINGVIEAKALSPVEPPAPVVSESKPPILELLPPKPQSAVVEAVVQSKSALQSTAAKADAESGAASGRGGDVQILGDRVAIVEAAIDASGPSAGGTVLIGGDYQGKNPDIQNARFTYVGPHSTINVDATQSGSGGRAIVWADEATHFAATLTARGGTGGGDGGFVETSGKGMLIVRRAPDVSARRNGRSGTWLLDPTDITIGGVETSITDVDPTGNFEFRGSGTTSTIDADTITAALASGNVIVSTASAAGGTGNITVAQSFSYTSANSLTLQADNDIQISGFQVTNSGPGAIALNAGAAGRVLVHNGGVSTAGALSVTGRELEVIGDTSPAFLESTASTVNVTVTDLLRVDSGLSVGSVGRITSATGQTINAKHIELVAQNDGARIENTISGVQSITTSGTNAGGEGILVENLNSSAASAQIVNAGGGQTITVNNADHVRVMGLGGTARISAAGDQSLLMAGSGLNGIALGDASALRASLITSSAGNQSITAGQGAQQGFIIVAGGSGDGFNSGIVLTAGGGTQNVSARNTITLTGGQSAGVAGSTLCTDRGACGLISTTTTGAQSVTAAGITIIGGSSNSSNIAGIFGNSGASQSVTIANGGNLSLTGGAGAGSTNTADISNSGAAQTITFSAGGALQLTGGTLGKLNFARVRAQGASSTQTILGATSISLAGGASGGGFTGGTSEGNFAQIRAAGAQNIGVGAGGISLMGGGGTQTDNFAMIFQAGTTSTSQQITNAGDITLQGGTSSGIGGVNGSFAYIRADGDGGQTIDFGAGRTLSLTGGINGNGNFAQVRSTNGTQTITGAPAVTLAGGASGGGADEGNYALINALNGNSQNFALGTTTLAGGGGGIDNFAAIRANAQTVSVAGNLTLSGSSSGSGSGSGGSRIGSDVDLATNLNLDVSGAITLNGGAFANAGSALGPSNNSVSPQDSNVTVTAGGNITLNGGSAAGSRIGSPAGLVGAGTIVVTSTAGSIVLASNGVTGGNIRTTGSASLTASSAGQAITQASTNSSIVAGSLAASANSGIILDSATNSIAAFSATNAGSGNVRITNAADTLLTVSSIAATGSDVTITADDMAVTGAINVGFLSTVNLRPTTLSRNIRIEATPTAGTLSLTPTELGFVTAGLLQVGRSDGTGNLTVASALGNANIGATALRLIGTNIDVTAPIGAAGSEFAHHLEVVAKNDITVTDTEIRIADGAHGTFIADSDSSGAGTLSFINNTGSALVTSVGTTTANTANLQLSGYNVVLSGSSPNSIELWGAGTQTVTATNLLQLTGGSAPTGNDTQIRLRSSGNGSQNVTAHRIELVGGSAGIDNDAEIDADGIQNITVGAGGILLRGGSGTSGNAAHIYQNHASGTQTITVNSGATVALEGGNTGGPDNDASIENFATSGLNQTLNFTAGGTLLLTGGGGGTFNGAYILNTNGTQRILGSPDITLTGGAAGGATNNGNRARIVADNGTQIVEAHHLTLQGGGAVEGEARLGGGQTEIVTVLGNLTLQGGTGTDARASIGTNSDNVTLSVTVGGDTLLQGGSGGVGAGLATGARAQIGSRTGAMADITLNGGGDVTFVSGSGGVARLGGNDTTGDGTVVVRAGQSGTGSLVLNDGRIGTVGNVTLEATASGGQITQSAGGIVKATTLTTNSNSTTSLVGANTVTNLFATTAGGNITFSNAQSLVLGNASITTPAGAQTVSITTTGATSDITISGVTNTDDNITLTPGRDVVNAGTLTGASVVTLLFDTWTGGGGDLDWNNPTNWSRLAAPTASQDAVIPDLNGAGPTDTITISSGTIAARSVTSAEHLTISGGSLAVSGAASTVNGVLTVSGGTVTFDSGLTAAGGYVQSGGTLTGTGSVALPGSFSWSGGTISGSGALNTSGTTAITGATQLFSRPWSNTGTVTVSGSGSVQLAAGATLTNQTAGVVDLTGSAATPIGHVAGTMTFNNAGTINKTSAAAQTIDEQFNNTGTVNVNAGSLRFSTNNTDTGSYNVAGGAALEFNLGVLDPIGIAGAGSVDFKSGTIRLNNGFALAATGTVTISGASVQQTTGGLPWTFNDPLTVTGGLLVSNGTVTLNNDFVWSGGTFVGGSLLTTASTSTITAPSARTGNWNNSGIATIGGAGQVQLSVNSTFDNQNTLNLTGTGAIPIGTDGGPRTVVNSGTLNKSSGGTQTIDNQFSNTGTLNVSGGELAFTSFPTNAGAIALSNGATLSTSGLGMINTGTIGGVGTLNLGAAALTNRGTLRAGNSPGTLNMTGDLVLDGVNGSSTDIEIGGTTPGTQYDVINVSGQVRGGAGDTSNWGTLNVTHFGGFTPTSGQAFDIVNAGSVLAGDFTTKNFPATFSYASGLVGNTYRLSILGVPVQWILDGDGFWDVGTNWSGGVVPTAGDDVQINRGAGVYTVTVRAGQGAQAARSLTMAGDDNIAIAGDSLALGTSASSVNGVTTLSGGTLTANGALSLNSLAFTGGTLAGTGTVTVNGAFTNSGAANTTISGNLNVAGTGSLTGSGSTIVTSTGTLDISSFVNSNRLIDNAGTMVLSGTGQINTNSAVPVLNNQSTGLFDIQNDNGFAGDGGGSESITNAGIFRKSAGTGTSNLANVAFVNSGTVEVQSGTLSFPSGTVTSSGTFDTAVGAQTLFAGANSFNGGTRFTGAGANKVTAGSPTFTGTLTVDNLELAGGTIAGTATFTRSSGPGLTWSSGSFDGGGVLTLDPTMLTTISGAGSKTINSYRLANQGTLTWAAGAGNIGTTSAVTVIDNSGLFVIQNDSTLLGDGGGFETVLNSGTIRKTVATGASTFSAVTLSNAGGTLDIQSGQLTVGSLAHSGATSRVSAGTVNVSGGGAGSGTMTLDAGAQVNITGGTQTLANGTTVAGAGAYRVAGGTLDIAGTVSASNVDVASGTLSGVGNLVISGTLNFSGGSQTTGTTTVANGGTLNVSGAGVKGLSRTLVNEAGGTMNLSGTGTITTTTASTVIDNRAGGQINITADQIFQGDGGGNELVINAGTVTKTGGAGSTVFNGVTFNNAAGGVLSVQSGTVAINSGGASSGGFDIGSGSIVDIGGGGYTLGTGATSVGAGNLRNASGGTLNVAGNASVNNLIQTSGAVDGVGTLTLTGTMAWSGGSMVNTSGQTVVASSGRIDVTGPVTLNRPIDNSGSLVLSGAGQVNTNSAVAVLNNQTTGLVDIQNNGGFSGDGGGNETITNAGIFRKSAGSGTSNLTNVAFNNAAGGSVQAQSGTLAFTTGAVTSNGTFDTASGAQTLFTGSNSFGNGTQFTGLGSNKVTGGSQTFSGTLTVDNLELAGGSFGGTATFTRASGPGLTWSGGSFDGGGVLTFDPTMLTTISGVSAKTINNYRLANQGTLTWAAGAGNIATTSAVTVIDNSGLFLIQNDASLAGDGGGFETVTNSGTIRKTVATGTSTFNLVTLNNAGGTLDIQSGQLQVGALAHSGASAVTAGTVNVSGGGSGSGSMALGLGAQLNIVGGTQSLANGTAISGAGVYRVNGGTLDIPAGSVDAQNLDVAAGTLSGAGNLNISGTMNFSGGSQTIGTTTVASGGVLNIAGAGAKTLSRTLVNLAGGTIAVSGAGQINTNSATTVLDNRAGGQINISADQVFQGDGGGTESIVNAGTITKTGGAGTTAFNIVAVNNAASGVLDVQSGTIQVSAPGANSGTIRAAAGAVFSTGGSSLTNASGAILEGSGTIDTGAAAIVNDGTIRPGGSNAIGTLTLTGALTQGATGTLQLEAAGTGAGQFDVLNVGGALTGVVAGNLGALSVAAIGGYTPVAGDTLALLNHGSRTGLFSSLAGPGGLFTNPIYGTSAFAAQLGSSALNSWIAAGDGNWDVATNWSLGHVPIASEDVLISDIGAIGVSNTITVPSAGQQAQSLVSAERLTISGPGSLDLAQASTISGLATLAGGTLTGTGDVTLSGGLAWTGGTISGSGTVSVTGGTLALTTSGAKTLDGKTLSSTVASSITGADLDLANGATFANRAGATLALTANGFTRSAGSATLLNEGNIDKTNSGTSVAIGDIAFVNTGTTNVTAGTLSLPVGSATSGSGTFNVTGGSSVLDVGGTLSTNALSINSATVQGSGSITTGTLDMTAGIVRGTGPLGIMGASTFNGVPTIDGRGISNFGSATQASQLRLNNGAVWHNKPGSSYDVAGDVPLLAFVGTGTFTNEGTFMKSGGTGIANINGLTFDNMGAVQVAAGDLQFVATSGTHSGPFTIASGARLTFSSNLTHTMNPGATVTGPGTLVVRSGTAATFNDTVNVGAFESLVSGVANFNAPATMGAVTVGAAAGTANFNDTATLGSLHVRGGGTVGGSGGVSVGSLTLNGGAISGSGAFTVSGTTLISTNATDNPTSVVNQIVGRTLTNAGAATQTGADLRLNDGAVWSNQSSATYSITDDFGILSFSGGGTFSNAGIFAKTGGTGASVLTNLQLDNAGTMSIAGGELRLNTTSLTNTGGIDIAAGATFGIPQGLTLTGGTLGGTGTIVVGVGTSLTNSGGIVQPGGANSIGTLTITGSYFQVPGGQLDIDLGGTGTGQFDRLLVSNLLAVGGTLNVVSANGYVGSPGDVTNADIVSGSALGGAFASVTGAFVQPVTTLYSPNSVRITLAPLGTNAWRVDADGAWNNPANWNLGHVPTAGEDVLIDRPAALYTITLPSGTQDVRSVIAAENLAISGGSLSVQQSSSFNGAVNIAGGTLTGAGDKLINELVLSAGAINGSGNVVVSGAYTHTGGAIDIGGALAVIPVAGDVRVGGPIRASAVGIAAPGALRIDAPVTAATAIGLSSGASTTITADVSAGTQFGAAIGGIDGSLAVVNAAVVAPQFDVLFHDRSQGGIFVNGTEGVLSSGSVGFFSGVSQPAVLGTTFRVTYGVPDLGGLGVLLQEESVAINQIIQEVTRSITLSTEAKAIAEEIKERLEEKVAETESEGDAKAKDEKRKRRQVCS